MRRHENSGKTGSITSRILSRLRVRGTIATLGIAVLVMSVPSVLNAQTAPGADRYSDLDLREAHVLDVTYVADGNSYRFDVTLIHDDSGESGYADWWQVETLDGRRLGRRTLLHAHGTQPFTRSEVIEIPPSVTRIVVRGHDQTHGYGGTAMIIDLESGLLRDVDQGEDPDDFTSYLR